jgi:hypothetical protein
MLFLVLEACAVSRACLDGQAYEALCRHPELRSLEETGRHLLSESAAVVGLPPNRVDGYTIPKEVLNNWNLS